MYEEEGLVDGVYGLLPKGVPSSGTIDVETINTTFQLQPYDTENSLQLGNGVKTGTLQLSEADQGSYGRIAVLSAGGSTFAPSARHEDEFNIHFADGTIKYALVKTDDWYASDSSIAIRGFGRVDLRWGGDDTSSANPRLYYTLVDLSPIEREKVVTSFEFIMSDSDWRTPNLLAISAGAIPEPSTLSLLLGGLCLLTHVHTLRRRRRLRTREQPPLFASGSQSIRSVFKCSVKRPFETRSSG